MIAIRSASTRIPFEWRRSALTTLVNGNAFNEADSSFSSPTSSPNNACMQLCLYHSPAYRRMQARKKGLTGGISSQYAKDMATNIREMDNTTLITLAAFGKDGAHAEVLIRHIMSVDDVDYEEACVTFQKIANSNRRFMAIHALPYLAGLSTSVVAAFASFPLCFHKSSVAWFNEKFVTTDVPEPEDLETWLEVGSWAWNWMEPPLGQISFFLLCLQFARAQMVNLGIKPYTNTIKQLRALRVSTEFPKYDRDIISDYSRSIDVFS